MATKIVQLSRPEQIALMARAVPWKQPSFTPNEIFIQFRDGTLRECDPFSDLAACAELEASLNEDEQIEYACALWKSLDAHGWGEERGWWILLTASASAKADAYGKVKKLWD